MRMISAGVSLVLLLGIASQAHAVPTLQISDGVNPTIIVGDSQLADSAGAPGIVSWAGTLGGWVFTVETGITKPAQGTATNPYLHLNTVATSIGAGSLSIYFSETHFTGDGLLKGIASLSSMLGGSSLNLDVYYDEGNTLFSTANLLASITTTDYLYSDADSMNFDYAGEYSLTLVANLVHGAGVQTSSFDAEARVPEPGSIALLGMGLVVVGFARRRGFRPGHSRSV